MRRKVFYLQFCTLRVLDAFLGMYRTCHSINLVDANKTEEESDSFHYSSSIIILHG